MTRYGQTFAASYAVLIPLGITCPFTVSELPNDSGC